MTAVYLEGEPVEKLSSTQRVFLKELLAGHASPRWKGPAGRAWAKTAQGLERRGLVLVRWETSPPAVMLAPGVLVVPGGAR